MKLPKYNDAWLDNGLLFTVLIVAWPLVLALYMWQIMCDASRPISQTMVDDAKRKYIARNRIEERRQVIPRPLA
ncbi:MAG: hypothetical protein WCO80_11770 [Betaproteobacteria bacterium]|jgi:hypothetical protein|nr:hypothetical protein [Betaproteobacteria bacterium]NBT66243.1 hypothetical protein [Betaproteobacteria bacterium]NBY08758.1 hypothetical protein [Betaproteobacteria bacterium]